MRTTPAESCSSRPGVLDALADDGEDLLDARLDDVAEHAARRAARLLSADARDLDLLVVGDHAAERAAEEALQAVGLGHRRAQARGDVVRDVVAADRDDARVGDAAVDVEEDVGRAAADVDDRDADLALVVGEDGLGARERLEDDVGDDEAAALGAADDVLDAARGGRDEVHLRAEAHAAHPDRVADAVLDVDDVLARQDVEDLAIGVDRDGAGALEDALDVGAGHLAAGDRGDAVGRLRADVAAGDAA